MTKKEELIHEYANLTEELEEAYKRLDDVRQQYVKPLIVTKELLQEYELLLTRKTQVEKRMREITIEMSQLRRRE